MAVIAIRTGSIATTSDSKRTALHIADAYFSISTLVVSGTADEVIDQVAQWRDMGARYIVVADVSSLQGCLRKGMASAIPFGRILRGIKKL